MNPAEQSTARLLTPRQVAEWLRVSVAWVSSHARGKHRPVLPSVKMGKLVRFRADEVQAFIDECQRILEKRA